MKPLSIAIAILVHNEEHQVPRLIKMLKGTDADRIIFFDDYSDDDTIEAIPVDEKIGWYVELWDYDEERFDVKKNAIHKFVKKDLDCKWVLHIDADEQFDPFFLKNIKKVIKKLPRTTSIAHKRINLPNGNDFPDYQVRLMRTDTGIEWRGKYHEKPYSNVWVKPLVDLAMDYKGNVNEEGVYYCIILEKFPIIHLPRRTDLKRPWW